MSKADLIRQLRLSGLRYDGALLAEVVDLLEPARRTGWVSYGDSEYTESSPLSLPAGVRTQMTIDGVRDTQETYRDGINPNVWANDTFTGDTPGASYLIRVGFTLKTTEDMFSGITGLITSLSTAALKSAFEAENQVTLEFDFGFFNTKVLTGPRVQGDTLDVTDLFFIHTGPAVINPGGQLFLTATADSEAYDFDITIQRLYTPEA